MALFGRPTADFLLDRVDLGDALQGFLRERCLAARVDKPTPQVRPAVGFLDAGVGSVILAKLVVGLPGIDLQNALVATQQLLAPHLSAAWHGGVELQRRITATMAAVIAADHPQVSGLGLASSRGEPLHVGFVSEQPWSDW